MATYLYCVLIPPVADSVPRALTGIADAPVRALVVEGERALEAWVSTVNESVLQVKGRALASQALMHNEIVNAALGTGRTPAPARYGSRFVDDDACVVDLRRRSMPLSTVLDRIAGMVEMPVLLVPSPPRTALATTTRPSSSEPAAGRRYLEAVRSRTREAREQRSAADSETERLNAAVADYVRGESRSLAATGVISVAHLVRRTEIDAYRRALAAFLPDNTFRLIAGEPRAPYSFAAPEADRAGHDSGSREWK